jgi:hypothetical protein
MQAQIQPLVVMPQYHQAAAPVYNQTTTLSPAKKSPLKQDTLTHNDWEVQPIPVS